MRYGDDLDRELDPTLFTHSAASERVRSRVEAKALAEERARMFEEQEAAFRAAAAVRQAETNERFRLAEYRRYGVEPPFGMSCTLSLLFRLGWTVETVDNVPTLLKPVGG